MKYLNVSTLGLTGRLHPAITGVSTPHEVRKMRPHIKMLTGNYLTFEIRSLQFGGSAECRLCSDPIESFEHLISYCSHFNDIRLRIKSEMMSICTKSNLKVNLNDISSGEFNQFILDPSSLNLAKRVNITHPE